MKLEQLEEFLKICRKKGITEIKFSDSGFNLEVKFGDLPKKPSSQKSELSETAEGMPNDEDLAFFHVEPGIV